MVTPTRPLTSLAPAVALFVLATAACTAPPTQPGPAPRVAVPARPGMPQGPPSPVTPPAGEAPAAPVPAPEVVPPPPAPGSAATATLVERSRQQAAAGDLPLATASLERALRINPRDPGLWLELGRLKLREGDFAQAESMAKRASAVAGADPRWRGEIDALLTEARHGMR